MVVAQSADKVIIAEIGLDAVMDVQHGRLLLFSLSQNVMMTPVMFLEQTVASTFYCTVDSFDFLGSVQLFLLGSFFLPL